jgi:hypothetical protein
MKFFALVMCALYVLAGCVFLFTTALEGLIPRYRIPLGLLLGAYGVVRAYMWRMKYTDLPDGE